MGERNRCSVTWMLAVTVSLASLKLSAGLVTCDFRDDFCGWTPTAVGGIWERYSGSNVNGIRPPSGVSSFAYILSGQESYAQLESQEINLHTASAIRFRVVQMRSEFSSSNNMAELVMIPSDGSEQKILWHLRNTQSQFGWTNPYVEVPLLPDMGSFKLKLRFKVGSMSFTSAVASINLLNELAVIALPTTPTIPTTTTPASVDNDRFLSCTFRFGMCAWANMPNHAELSIIQGSNVGLGQPGAPTASSDNYYLFVRGNSGLESTLPVLESPFFVFTGASTFTFWYRQSSDAEDVLLRVSVMNELYEGGGDIVFESINNTGTWAQHTINLLTNGTVQISIGAVVNSRQTVSLDEIQWSGDREGSPETVQTTTVTTTKATTPTSTMTPKTTIVATSRPDDAVSLTCTFASTFCGWFPETTDEIYQWRLTKLVVAAPNNITGVAGNGNEGFLWAQGNSTDEERESRLVSRSVTLSSPATLRFWTYATAAMGSGISVNLLLPSGEERVVEFDAVERGEWVQKTVTISETGTYSIVIAANVTRIRRFGLDEIVFLTTEDPVYGEGPLTALTTLPTTTETTTVPTTRQPVTDGTVTCSFAVDQCGWRTDPISEGEWKRTEDAGVPNLPITSSPLIDDHWFISFRGANISSDRGYLRSARFTNDRARNFTFWFYKRGVATSVSYLGFRVENETGVEGLNIWRFGGEMAASWDSTSIPITQTGDITLVFYCGATNYIVCGVDEIELEGEKDLTIQTPPTLPPQLDSTISCAFENPNVEFCGWRSDPGGLQWQRAAGPVGDINYGLNGGPSDYYIYADSNGIAGGRQVARLVSSSFNRGPINTEMTFWYRVYGAGVDNLEVLLEGHETLQVIWSNATRSRDWNKATVRFCANDEFHIAFEAKFFYAGFVVGLDDILLLNEFASQLPVPDSECPNYATENITTAVPYTSIPIITSTPRTFPTFPTITTTQSTTPAPFTVLPNLGENGTVNCNFDGQTTCGWKPALAEGKAQFQVASAGTVTGIPNGGPGSFLYANSSVGGFRFLTVSSPIDVQLKVIRSRFQFNYASYGRGARSLSVFVLTNLNTVVPLMPVWSFNSFGVAKAWTTGIAEIFLPNNVQSYRILLEAKFTLPNSVIAIDSFILEGEDGATIGTTSATATPPTQAPPVSLIPAATCHFDSRICDGWSNVGEIQWTEATTAVEEANSGAEINAAQAGTGFIYASTVGAAEQDTARLSTAEIKPDTSNNHTYGRVTFWVHYSGALNRKHRLNIYADSLDIDAEEQVYFGSSETDTERWVFQQADFCLNGRGRLAFEAHDEGLSSSLIGLDEIITLRLSEIGAGVTCPEPIPTVEPFPQCMSWERVDSASCTFNGVFCIGWTTPDETYPFIFQNSVTGDPPFVVNGSQSGAGYAVTSCYYNNPAPVNVQSAVRLPEIPALGGRLYGRISFWYFFTSVLNENKYLLLNAAYGNSTKEVTLWKVDQGQSAHWKFARVDFVSAETTSLIFSVSHNTCETPVALDSVVTERGDMYACDATTPAVPTADPANSRKVTCSFENNDICGWHLTNAPNRWKLGNGPVGTGGYALNGSEHGQGFLYLDSNNLPRPNEPAEIRSYGRVAETTVFSFFYRAHGFGVAALTLYAQVANTRYELWSAGDSGRNWVNAIVPVCFNDPFYFVFEGQFSSRGFIIALDEVFLGNESTPVVPTEHCPILEPYTTAAPPVTTESVEMTSAVPSATSPTPVLPPAWNGDVSCNFENGDLCGWRHLDQDKTDLTWTVVPQYGFNLNPQNYISAAAEGRLFAVASTHASSNSSIARLISPNLALTGSAFLYRVQFYYRASGRGGSGISIFIATSDVFPTEPDWTTGQGTLGVWNRAVATLIIEPDAPRRQLILETQFFQRNSWIAIDDIILEGENGQTVGTPQPAGTTSSPVSIINEGTCSFDVGFCQEWTVSGEPSWEESVSSNYSNVTAQAGRGFVFVDNDRPVEGNRTYAELVTPQFPLDPATNQTSGSITFWYLTGPGTTIFGVFSKTGETVENKRLWQVTANGNDNSWKRAEVEFTFTDYRSVTFSIAPGATFSFAALDEVVTYRGEVAPPCVETVSWELVPEASCNFNTRICSGWTTPESTYPFVIQTSMDLLNISTNVTSEIPIESGYALTSCAFDYPMPIHVQSGLQLPQLSADAQSPFSGRVSFWYYFADHGNDTWSLQLILNGTGAERDKLLWASFIGRPQWRFAQVEFRATTNASLIFLVYHDHCETPLAIDSVVTEREIRTLCPDSTQGNVTCGFENNQMCGWQQTEGLNHWKLGSGLVGTGGYALNGTLYGDGFLYLDSNILPRPNQPTDIRTHTQPAMNSQFTFFYRAHGFGVASLTLFAEVAGTRYSLWSAGDSGRNWISVSVPVCFNEPFRFVFEGQFSARGFVIAVDEIVLLNDLLPVEPTTECVALSPHTTVAPPAEITDETYVTEPIPTESPVYLLAAWNGTINCDFEDQNLCDWRPLQLENQTSLTWSVVRSYGSGITNASFAAEGSYFAVSSTDFGNGSIARLMSPNIDIVSNVGEAVWIQFYYRTSGRSAIGISVYAATSDELPSYPVWSFGQGVLGEWNQAVATIDIPAGRRRQLILESHFTRKNSWIAIDDITLHGEDGATVLPPSPGTTVAPIGVIEAGTCSFDVGLCRGWISNGSYIWRESGAHLDVPPQSGRGYVYVDNDRESRQGESFAELITPVFGGSVNTASQTITFWYLVGRGITKFELLRKRVTGTQQAPKGTIMWEVTRIVDNVGQIRWEKVTVSFCTDSKYTLSFRVTPGRIFSVAALDEVLTFRDSSDNCEPCSPEWQKIAGLSCSFDERICSGFTTPSNQYPFVHYKPVTIGGLLPVIPTLNQNGSTAGYAITDCFTTFPAPTMAASSIQLPFLLPDNSGRPVHARISFWYHYAALNSTDTSDEHNSTTVSHSRLDVTVISVTPQVVWSEALGPAGNVWRLGQVEYKSVSAASVGISVMEFDCDHPVAIDEVVTERDVSECGDESVNTEITCGFDEDSCGWKNNENQYLNWRITRGDGPLENAENRYLVPQRRNTTANATGGVARLVSSYGGLNAPETISLTFYYRLQTAEGNYLKLSMKNLDEEFELWRSRGTHNRTWEKATVLLCDSTGYQLVFETTTVNVALDEVELAGEASTNATCPSSPVITCDFEDGTCGWRTDIDKEFRFGRTSGPVGTLENLIIEAAAEGNRFVYADANSRANEGDEVASLFTNGQVKLRKATTFSFWYHARGYGIRFLRLQKLKVGLSGLEWSTLWTTTGEVGFWQQVNITLCDETAFMLFFQASFTLPDHVVALDGFVLENESTLLGDIPEDTYVCPGLPITTITCDFEDSNNCGWRNVDSLGLDWERSNGTISADPQHSIVNASSGDNYLVAVANKRPFGHAIARIISRPINSAMPQNTHLDFWYNMKGAGISYLRVIVRETASDQVLWERNGHQGLTWQKASITICAPLRARIVFETAFTLPDHLVGLDEVVFHGETNTSMALPGGCPIVSCNFETSTCGWGDDNGTFAGWDRTTGLVAQNVEHIETTPDGFWYLSTSGYRQTNETVSRTMTSCFNLLQETTIDFWHHAHGAGVKYLRLIAYGANQTETVIWEQIGGNNETWQRDYIPMERMSGVRLIFEAAFTQRTAVVGIDKVKLLNEAELVELAGNCDVYIPPTTPATTTAASTTTVPTTSSNTTATESSSSKTLSCSFDHGLCAWQNSHDDGFVISSGTSSINPLIGTGFALNSLNGTTNLTCPPIALKSRTQMFFYFYDGFSMMNNNEFHVTIFAQRENGSATQLWQYVRPPGQTATTRWYPARVPLCMSGMFRIVIQVGRRLNTNDTASDRFGLDNLVVNDELTVISTTPTTFTCPTAPTIANSMSCNLVDMGTISSITTFCGWRETSAVGVTLAIGTVDGVIEAGHAAPVFFYVTPLSTNDTEPASVVMQSRSAVVESPTALFSFWYQMRGTSTTVDVLYHADTDQPIILTTLASPRSVWTQISLRLNHEGHTRQWNTMFKVNFQAHEKSVFRDADDLFALDDVWYSAENGFIADEQIDIVGTTTTPLVTADSTTMSVGTSTTSDYSTTTPPVTTITTTTVKPAETSTIIIPQRPTSAASTTPPPDSRLSTQNIVIISVGSVAGALILLAVFVALLHCRSKRRERRGSKLGADREIAMEIVSAPPSNPSTRPASAMAAKDPLAEPVGVRHPASEPVVVKLPVSNGMGSVKFVKKAFDE